MRTNPIRVPLASLTLLTALAMALAPTASAVVEEVEELIPTIILHQNGDFVCIEPDDGFRYCVIKTSGGQVCVWNVEGNGWDDGACEDDLPPMQ